MRKLLGQSILRLPDARFLSLPWRLVFLALAARLLCPESGGPQSTPSSETLEQSFTDLLTTLPQLVVRDAYSPATYGTHVDGWYLRSAEATWTMGWRHNSPTILPLSLGVGKTIVRPDLPPMSLFVTGQWTVYRQFAPITPQTSVNFGVSIAFPGLKAW